MDWTLRHFNTKDQSAIEQPTKDTEKETSARKEIICELR